ncbi:dihydrodipicolinate synthase family protein [Oceanispirochaeta crateris]|uniref:Dihydrodipicolinate synthase family protein n=1 Tax=Oceanispirochaeta crateris TaxID=2518645 RepID=A0A5C1QF45_9SPIO|nr:dihydrodipicolinate synthase family protein [Oceanispirochaeta crateris]QEN06723.1 dihydrodipicolinate synthase family protein [Oceanispirochaeta crateris]
MNKEIGPGVYPTMITPFKEDLSIDYNAVEKLIEWYLNEGIDGLFAICQSSSMFNLSRKEKKDLAGMICKTVPESLPVIASGHTSDTLEEQAVDLNDMADAGVDALVLISNRFATPFENDDIWIENLDRLLTKLPSDIPLGFYECPYPYKRILSEKVIKHLIDVDRFEFIKDTCCDPLMIKDRAKLCKETKIKLYNANAASLLMSLQEGYNGYSGVMANFHSHYYYWMCKNWKSDPNKAEKIQNYLTIASDIERQYYPANAKYILKKEGVLSNTICRRSEPSRELSDIEKLELDHFYSLSKMNHEYFFN